MFRHQMSLMLLVALSEWQPHVRVPILASLSAAPALLAKSSGVKVAASVLQADSFLVTDSLHSIDAFLTQKYFHSYQLFDVLQSLELQI